MDITSEKLPKQFTFEELPQAISQIYSAIGDIKGILLFSKKETAPDQEELLTVPDAAKFLSLSVPTIYGLIHKGEIPVMKRSKRCYFSKSELMIYIKQGRRTKKIANPKIST